MTNPTEYTVRFPSTGATGVFRVQRFASFQDAVRFATSKKTYLRRAYGPRLASLVTVEEVR
jgi:hypothetical protein